MDETAVTCDTALLRKGWKRLIAGEDVAKVVQQLFIRKTTRDIAIEQWNRRAQAHGDQGCRY